MSFKALRNIRILFNLCAVFAHVFGRSSAVSLCSWNLFKCSRYMLKNSRDKRRTVTCKSINWRLYKGDGKQDYPWYKNHGFQHQLTQEFGQVHPLAMNKMQREFFHLYIILIWLFIILYCLSFCITILKYIRVLLNLFHTTVYYCIIPVGGIVFLFYLFCLAA
ncbi:Uncharacterized protein HZ326_4190 [Fusarium oxysporum f. sp. albedinis]|nr:Uncharacterized protein HZ326_4190 [Fusarium oxysporum f. sp. albedinis]